MNRRAHTSLPLQALTGLWWQKLPYEEIDKALDLREHAVFQHRLALKHTDIESLSSTDQTRLLNEVEESMRMFPPEPKIILTGIR